GGREKWRDFVLEFDVAFEHPGNLDLFARLGRHAGQAVGMTLAVSPPDVPPAHVWTGPTLLVGEGVLRPRAPYACEVTCLGSRFRVKIGDGAPHEYEEEIRWTKSRRGSIGLVVPEGTRVTFTRMRIRVLR
ncbi:MAG TPA: hypothetical protein VKF62_14475, partial [Planctomycetota bacterium]|nr:hypothetical protein [Planctomycetota bacterium]